jgi:macrolide transport system ATP-binding/permease protein
VNKTFVKDLIPARSSPIGRRFGSPGPDTDGDFEIAGVVEDTVYTSALERSTHVLLADDAAAGE